MLQLDDSAATRIQSEVDFMPVRSEHTEKRVRKRALVSAEGRYIVDLESGEESLFYFGDDAAELRDRSGDEEFSAMLEDFRGEMKKIKWWSGE
jgi:erythromycin esterase-like protein